MIILRRALRATALLLAVSAGVSTAHADDEPPVLDQTARVQCIVGILGACEPLAIGSTQHSHPDFKKWRLKPGKSEFKVNPRRFDRERRYFDLSWVWFNEMQDPKLHVINSDKVPLSENHFEPTTTGTAPSIELTDLKLKDFIFAFGIHMLENADKSETPHALIYIPQNWKLNATGGKGTTFSLFVFHIPDDDRDCRYEKFALLARHCLVLRRLAETWAKGTPAELAKQVQEKYHLLGENFWDCLKDPPAGADPCPMPHPGSHIPAHAEAAPMSDHGPHSTVATIVPWQNLTPQLVQIVVRIFMHNGVVHGKLF